MMIKKTIATVLLTTSVFVATAQNYAVLFIPDSIKNKADAVIQMDDTFVEIEGQRSMKIVQKTAITILNKSFDEAGNLTIHYDKQRKINAVELNYYDAIGKLIKKVKRSEFMDFAAVDGFSLYSDNRVIHYNYTPISYPYTVVYEYEITSNNTAFLPSWEPLVGHNIGLINSSYTIKFPDGFKVQKLEKNFGQYPINSSFISHQYSYSLKNQKPIKVEEMSPPFEEMVPHVQFAVNIFHLAGVDGKAENWVEFGLWMQNELLASRNNLSKETKDTIKQMVSGVTDPKEKAKIIYEYVQNKTRYISVQIGVGGWMPMYTDDVDRLAYGDCKALTFYTKSLLEEVGVPAYYSAVYAGDDKRNIEKDLISVQGNHVFLILPMEKDSIFLECTSQKSPFDIKSDFTEDRDVLSITPEGGKIIRTPAYKPEENLQLTSSDCSLDDKGTLTALIDIKSYGNQYSHHILYFDGRQPHELDAMFKEYFSHINNILFTNIDLKNNRDLKRYEEKINFTAAHYAVINTDGSILFSPNAFNRTGYIPPKVTDRTTPFVVENGFKDEDEYIITLPDNYKADQLPEPVNIVTDFGVYNMSIEEVSEHKLKYKRTLIMYNNRYEKNLYESYRKFKKDLKKNDEMRILINKI